MSPEAIVWLQKYLMAASSGIAPGVKICTGRNIPFVSAILYMLGRPHGAGFSILENGSVFYSTDSREFFVNPQISRKALAQLRLVREKIAPEIVRRHPDLWIFPGNVVNTIFVRKSDSVLPLYSLKRIIRREVLIQLNKLTEETIKNRLSKRKKIPQKLLSAWIRERLRKLRTAISIVRFGDGFAVVPRGINKGTAVDFLQKKEGIDLKHSLGIGDSNSDISFLKRLGFMGCPCNAEAECSSFVKAHRGKVSLLPFLSGVVDIISYLIPTDEINVDQLTEYHI